MPAPAPLPFELVLYFECFACSSVVLIIGEQWKCVSQPTFQNLSKPTCLRKLSGGGAQEAESFKLERLSQTFHTGAT